MKEGSGHETGCCQVVVDCLCCCQIVALLMYEVVSVVVFVYDVFLL